MGHLLGASPRPAGSHANPVSPGSPGIDATWVEVDSLDLHSPDPGGCRRVCYRSATTWRSFPWPRTGSQRLGHRARGPFEAFGPPDQAIKAASIHLTCGVQMSPPTIRNPHLPALSGFSAWAPIDPSGTRLADRGRGSPGQRRSRSRSPRSGDESSARSQSSHARHPRGCGARFRHHRHAARRHDVAARLSQRPSASGNPNEEGACISHRPLRTRTRLVSRAVSGRTAAGRHHRRSHAVRALSPPGAAAIARDRTSRQD